MFSKIATLVLATIAIGQAVATPFRHSHFHAKRDAEPVASPSAELVTRGFNAWLKDFGIPTPGINAQSEGDGQDAWLGSDGHYTGDFKNDAAHDITLVIWGPWKSWVNAHPPLITVGIPKGESKKISFASGCSGGFTAIHPDTKMNEWGQIKETWGEYTFSPTGVVDVSRLVNMDGHSMSIKTPSCTTDMDNCVFKCTGGLKTCMDGYALEKCVNSGIDPSNGGASGGCGWWGHEGKMEVETIFT